MSDAAVKCARDNLHHARGVISASRYTIEREEKRIARYVEVTRNARRFLRLHKAETEC